MLSIAQFSLAFDVRIIRQFVPHGCSRSVTGKNHSGRIKREDFFTNTVEKERSIATGQIPATDPLTKQNVSANKVAGVWKIKTKAARAMARHMQGDDALVCDHAGLTFFEENVRRDWIVVDIKSVTLKKTAVRDHGKCIRMTNDLTAMPSLDFAGIHHMIKVSVREDKPVDFLMGEVGVGPLWRIEKNVARRRFEEIRIGRERAASKNFELN